MAREFDTDWDQCGCQDVYEQGANFDSYVLSEN